MQLWILEYNGRRKPNITKFPLVIYSRRKYTEQLIVFHKLLSIRSKYTEQLFYATVVCILTFLLNCQTAVMTNLVLLH